MFDGRTTLYDIIFCRLVPICVFRFDLPLSSVSGCQVANFDPHILLLLQVKESRVIEIVSEEQCAVYLLIRPPTQTASKRDFSILVQQFVNSDGSGHSPRAPRNRWCCRF